MLRSYHELKCGNTDEQNNRFNSSITVTFIAHSHSCGTCHLLRFGPELLQA